LRTEQTLGEWRAPSEATVFFPYHPPHWAAVVRDVAAFATVTVESVAI